MALALALPFSVLFAVIAMGQFGISANLMSLGGLAIAVGMMVDGAVVMVENVGRHLREARADEPRTRVVARACREVGHPIVFAIAIIIIVFLPLFTLTILGSGMVAGVTMLGTALSPTAGRYRGSCLL